MSVGRKKVQRKKNEAQLAQDESSDSDGVLLMATTKSKDENFDLWYLDTGCSNHMIGHREWFMSLDEKVKSKIKFSDYSNVTTEGIGKVMIKRRDGYRSFISDVLCVLKMKNNLLSLGQILDWDTQ